MSDVTNNPGANPRDEEETLGFWGRIGVYSAGLAAAMAIFFAGALPQFRDALDGRGADLGGDVSALVSRTDEVLGSVRRELGADDGLGAVRATADGDVITLRGTVPTEADRDRSEAIALGVSGVRRVDNQINVAGGSAPAAKVTTTASVASTTVGTSASPAQTQATDSPPVVTTATPLSVPGTTAPPTTVAPTTVPATTAPATTVPPTTVAPTTVPPTTVPVLPTPEVQAQLNALVAAEPILFDSSSPTIRPESYATLDKVAALLAAAPNTAIEIQGHTDDRGTEATNLFLSQDRAGRVLVELAARGIEPARMTAVGYGQSVPVAPDDSDANRQLNRRIAFVLS